MFIIIIYRTAKAGKIKCAQSFSIPTMYNMSIEYIFYVCTGCIASILPVRGEIFCQKHLKTIGSFACELLLCIGYILYEWLLRKPRKIAENGQHCIKLCRPPAVQLTPYLCNKTMEFAHSSVKVQRNSCLTAKPFKNDFLLTTACTMHIAHFPSIIR